MKLFAVKVKVTLNKILQLQHFFYFGISSTHVNNKFGGAICAVCLVCTWAKNRWSAFSRSSVFCVVAFPIVRLSLPQALPYNGTSSCKCSALLRCQYTLHILPYRSAPAHGDNRQRRHCKLLVHIVMLICLLIILTGSTGFSCHCF